MALTAPIPTINGSQTEFSKVWIRGSTATATLPNIKLYSADGRAHHPYTGTLDVTIAHTAADTLYNRIQAAATAADATLTAARFDRWFKKARITGFSCDAITGDTLLVNRSEDTGLTDTNIGDDGRLPAKAAASFYAQETYPVGRPFTHGNIPAEIVGLTGATVNVAGEVEVAATWDRTTFQTAALAAVNDALTLACPGMGTAVFEFTAVSGTLTITWEMSIDGGVSYRTARATAGATASASSVSSSSANASTANRYWLDCTGATHVRIRVTASSGASGTVQGVVTAVPWMIPFSTTSGLVEISGQNSHNTAVTATAIQVGAEGRSTDGTVITSGRTTRLLSTLLGKLVNRPHALAGQTWQYAGPTGGITDTADDVVVASAGANVRNYITAIQVVNMSTTATEVVIKDGSTVIWRMELDADGGAAGISVDFAVPLRGTAAAAINVACLTTSSKVFVNAQGFTAAE